MLTSGSVDSNMLATIVLIDYNEQRVTLNSGKIINNAGGYAVAVVKGTFNKTGGVIEGSVSGTIVE